MMPRSYLFVPGDRPERFPKAKASGADVVIIDLEDAVALEAKDAARDCVRTWIRTERDVIVRINGVDSAEFDRDIELCRSAGVSTIVIPKAERREVLASIAAAAPQATLLPLIETARGIESVGDLAQGERVGRLLIGTVDLQLDLGIRGDSPDLSYFQSRLVLASRLAHLPPPVDGPCVSVLDTRKLADELHRARQLGCGGKLCVHPAQVPAVNLAFQPTPSEISWARRVLEAYEKANGAAVAVDGRMVDRPVVAMAQNILAQAKSS